MGRHISDRGRYEEAAVEVQAIDQELLAHDAVEARALAALAEDLGLVIDELEAVRFERRLAYAAAVRARARIRDLRQRDVRENRVHRAFRPAALALVMAGDFAGAGVA